MAMKHRPGANNIADYISRDPLSQRDLHNHEDIAERYINMVCQNTIPGAIERDELFRASREDHVLEMVRNWLRGLRKGEIGQYDSLKDELSITTDDLVLRGNRLCIPVKLQKRIVDIAHQGHQGIVKTKQLVRNYVWFPGIDAAVENVIKSCRECQVNTDKFQLQPLSMSPMPNGPWEELSIDFFGPMKNGKYLLVLIDDFSRYPIVHLIHSTGARTVIPHLIQIFSMFGTPIKIRSDNGPPFNGSEWKQFAKAQGFYHRRITPYWPRANGLCERFMRNLTKVLKNANTTGKNFEFELVTFLRNYRATPHTSTKKSPAELLLKTSTSTSKMPIYFKEPAVCEARTNDENAKQDMKLRAESRFQARRSTFNVGDTVLLKRPTITKEETVYDPIPFKITNLNGTQATISRGDSYIRRNVSQLKKIEESIPSQQTISKQSEQIGQALPSRQHDNVQQIIVCLDAINNEPTHVDNEQVARENDPIYRDEPDDQTADEVNPDTAQNDFLEYQKEELGLGMDLVQNDGSILQLATRKTPDKASNRYDLR